MLTLYQAIKNGSLLDNDDNGMLYKYLYFEFPYHLFNVVAFIVLMQWYPPTLSFLQGPALGHPQRRRTRPVRRRRRSAEEPEDPPAGWLPLLPANLRCLRHARFLPGGRHRVHRSLRGQQLQRRSLENPVLVSLVASLKPASSRASWLSSVWSSQSPTFQLSS